MAFAEPPLAQTASPVQLQQPFALRNASFVLPHWPAPPPLSQGPREIRLRAHRADTSIGKLRLHLPAELPAFQAVPGGTLSEAKIKFRMEYLEKAVKQCLDDLDRADRQRGSMSEARTEHLKQKIATIRSEMRKLRKIKAQLPAHGGQVSLTDPDARSMNSAGKGTGTVGYNVQSAVDTKNHLIVAHEVTNVGNDQAQLTEMSRRARKAIGATDLTAVADRGYFSGEEILRCEQAGMTPMVSKPLTSNGKADGRFDKRDFVYNARRNEYRCPAGQRAIWRFISVENGLTIHRYRSSACPRCPIKAKCTPSDYRRISRWEHEEVLDAMQRRVDRAPETAQLRRWTVEHPFGTLKAWMGETHFLTKTLTRVRTEMSLHVLAYNMKRVMNMLGTDRRLAAITA